MQRNSTIISPTQDTTASAVAHHETSLNRNFPDQKKPNELQLSAKRREKLIVQLKTLLQPLKESGQSIKHNMSYESFAAFATLGPFLGGSLVYGKNIEVQVGTKFFDACFTNSSMNEAIFIEYHPSILTHILGSKKLDQLQTAIKDIASKPHLLAFKNTQFRKNAQQQIINLINGVIKRNSQEGLKQELIIQQEKIVKKHAGQYTFDDNDLRLSAYPEQLVTYGAADLIETLQTEYGKDVLPERLQKDLKDLYSDYGTSGFTDQLQAILKEAGLHIQTYQPEYSYQDKMYFQICRVQDQSYLKDIEEDHINPTQIAKVYQSGDMNKRARVKLLTCGTDARCEFDNSAHQAEFVDFIQSLELATQLKPTENNQQTLFESTLKTIKKLFRNNYHQNRLHYLRRHCPESVLVTAQTPEEFYDELHDISPVFKRSFPIDVKGHFVDLINSGSEQLKSLLYDLGCSSGQSSLKEALNNFLQLDWDKIQ